MQEFRYLPGVSTLQLDSDACIGCGGCEAVCPHGVLVMNEKVQAALAGGGETGFGDTYFMTQPRFETGDEGYAWLNRVVAVGEGRSLPGAVEYRIFECANG